MKTGAGKGQATIELLTLYSLLFVPLVVASFYAYSTLSDSMRANQATSTLVRLANKAEELFAQGPGATAEVYVEFPNGIDWTRSFIGTGHSCPGPYVVLDMRGSSAFRAFDGRAIGWWPEHSGYAKMKLKTTAPSGIVSIAPASWPYHELTDYDWALASAEKSETYARFAGQDFYLQNLFDTEIFVAATGQAVPAAATFKIGADNSSNASVICSNEASPDPVSARCYAELYAFYGASWSLVGTAGEGGPSNLASGQSRAASGTFPAFPAGTTQLAVRFTAQNAGAGTSIYVQKHFLPVPAFYTVFYNEASQTTACAAALGYCCQSAEACSNSPGQSLNDYRQYGIAASNAHATCHMGTW